MSDQDDSDAFAFAFMVVGSPFCIFAFTLHCSSVYLQWALWKPFWKRYTEKVEGRVRRRVHTAVGRRNDGATGTHEIKHAIIEYNVKGVSMRRTFEAKSEGDWGCDGRPSIGSVSLETFDTINSLTLRLIPGLPESAIPELELDIQQRPFPWSFYISTLFGIAASSCWLGALVPLMEGDVWKKRALVVTVALYVTIWPVADIVARRFALAQMKRQETTKDFTAPYNDFAFLFHDANSDDTSQLQLQSLKTAEAAHIV
jgi:hypothetical protein